MAERPSSGHLDAPTVADLDAGVLDAEHAQEAAAHLEACPACRQLQADFSELRAVLDSAPAPPMPADVAERLDAALSAASRSRGTAEDGAGRVVELAPRRRRWVAPLAAAAAVVAAIGVVGEVVRSTGTVTDATSSADPTGTFDEEGGGDPGPQAGAEGTDRLRPLVLSTESFKRDVTRQLSGRVPAYEANALLAPSASKALQQQRCSSDRIAANAAKGDPVPALLDGREAYLYLAGPPADRVAIAVACERGEPTVAARARVDLD